jgi:hypothetical protein
MHPLVKRFVVYTSRIKLIRFAMLVWMWVKVNRWAKKCNDPLKMSIIEMMLISVHMGFESINWWIPKLPMSRVTDFRQRVPNLQEIARAADKERGDIHIDTYPK